MYRVLKLLPLFILFVNASARHGQIIWSKDTTYDVINFKVPKVIWDQALRPTPVLRSPVTIVVPINVPQDEDENEFENDADYVVTEINESVDTTMIVNDQIQNISENPSITNAPVANITQTPLLQDEVNATLADETVNGQVIRFPCACNRGQCGCCTGTFMERFKMRACGNMSFIPEDFVFDVRLSINNNTVVRRRVSASDPPPICFNPRRAPFVRVCAEISNIRIRNGNAFACLDINADIAGFPIYSASFRCFGFGSSGVQTGLKPKPVSSGPKPVSLFGSGNNENTGGFLETAGNLLGGNGGGILGGGNGAGLLGGGNGGGLFGGGNGVFGGPGGLFGGLPDAGGPFDAIGDAVGDFFGGRDAD